MCTSATLDSQLYQRGGVEASIAWQEVNVFEQALVKLVVSFSLVLLAGISLYSLTLLEIHLIESTI